MSKDGQAARAKRDLAKSLGIDESEITVQSAQSTEWEDASLGVSAPDSFSAQVLTPGYIIILRAKGRSYTYHADEDRRVVRA